MFKDEISKVNKNFINFFHEKIKDILYIIKNKTESELFIENYNTKMLLLAIFINTNVFIMNSLFCLYLPYYLDFSKYTCKSKPIK